MNDPAPHSKLSLHAFKLRLFQHCKETLLQRIDTALAAMNDAQQAANAEEKSSAGDKYETARGMAQLNKEMYAGQLQAHRAQLARLNLIDPAPFYDSIRPAALVRTDTMTCFIATGLGKIVFEDFHVSVLSADAPLASALLNHRVGESLSFNARVISILEIV